MSKIAREFAKNLAGQRALAGWNVRFVGTGEDGYARFQLSKAGGWVEVEVHPESVADPRHPAELARRLEGSGAL